MMYESNSLAPDPIREELVQRFSNIFDGIEPTTTSIKYDAEKPNLSPLRFFVKYSARQLRHDITKQTITKRVDDKKYLTGFYRHAEWGELVAEHVLEDSISDNKTREVIRSRPELYIIKFIDHSNYGPSGGVHDKTFVSSDVAFSYEFVPNTDLEQLTIVANRGPAIHYGDDNYPYFVRALELAEELILTTS